MLIQLHRIELTNFSFLFVLYTCVYSGDFKSKALLCLSVIVKYGNFVESYNTTVRDPVELPNLLLITNA